MLADAANGAALRAIGSSRAPFIAPKPRDLANARQARGRWSSESGARRVGASCATSTSHCKPPGGEPETPRVAPGERVRGPPLARCRASPPRARASPPRARPHRRRDPRDPKPTPIPTPIPKPTPTPTGRSTKLVHHDHAISPTRGEREGGGPRRAQPGGCADLRSEHDARPVSREAVRNSK